MAEVDHKLRGRPIFEAELQGERVPGRVEVTERWQVSEISDVLAGHMI